MKKILLAGESWISQSTHYKGFDSFTSVVFETGAGPFIAAAASQYVAIEQMYAHDVPARFPDSLDALAPYDAVILSDIGSNSLLLPPATWLDGRPAVNRLELLADYVRRGGGLMMAGGYLSFQGFQARANFGGTPLGEILPVTMLVGDDRVEAPQGVVPHGVDGVIGRALAGAPALLGYNRVCLKPDARLLATIGEAGDPLIAGAAVGQGRSLVWTSDIGPHWCPQPFLDWNGFAWLVGSMLRWLTGGEA